MMISNNKTSKKTTHKQSSPIPMMLFFSVLFLRSLMLSNNFDVDAQVNGKTVTAHIIRFFVFLFLYYRECLTTTEINN